jgi:hypothetical protein
MSTGAFGAQGLRRLQEPYGSRHIRKNNMLCCGVFVRLHLALFPAGGPFLPSLHVNLSICYTRDPGPGGMSCSCSRAGSWWVTFPSSTRRLRPSLWALPAPLGLRPLPGTPPSGARIGVLRPALRADVGRVLRAPWGPGPDAAWGLGRPGSAGWRAWPLSGRLHLGVRLRFALRSLAVWCVCAIAPSFISGWRAFSPVSLCKSICYMHSDI